MSKMPTKKVEDKGLRILNEYFENCDRVDTYLASNDKEPLWDGHVYLYNSSEQKADDIYGRIPSQVKSLSKTCSKEEYTYRIKRTALNSFKRDGGVLYFVILINNEVGHQIYYAPLTPVLIKKHLKAPGDKAEVSVKFKQLPADKQLVTEELFQLFFDIKKQTSSADMPIVEIEEYFNAGGKREFTVFAKSPTEIKDIFEHAQHHPLYLYATDENKNIRFAIGDGPVTLHMGRNLHEVVSVNGTPYFSGCTVIDEDEGRTITIGQYFTYRVKYNGEKSTVNFHFGEESNLKKITYLAFFLALLKHEEFTIGKTTIPFKGLDTSNVDLARMKEELRILNCVRSLFQVMHVKDDIDLTKLNSAEISNLEALYKAIVLKEPLTLVEGAQKNIRMVIGPLTFYLSFAPDGSGKYYIFDYFANEDVCCRLTYNDEDIITSRYCLLDTDHFVEAANFHAENIIESYREAVEKSRNAAELANHDMLRMILAYDRTDGKKTALLDAAETLNNWFMKTNRFEDPILNEINKYQIIRRRREFTEDEQERIIEISESNITEDRKTACMLLLGNQLSAEYHFRRLDENTQEFFKTLPIYHFWNNK